MARSKKLIPPRQRLLQQQQKQKQPRLASAAPKTTRVRKTVSISLQYGGMGMDNRCSDRTCSCGVAAEHGQKKTAAKDIKLYVKPEENMVYYDNQRRFRLIHTLI